MRLASFSLLAAVLSLSPSAAPAAQGTSNDTPLRPVTRTLALTNARVVSAPGEVMERATVILRDGRIITVGEDAALPPDAEVVKSDSLWVYAGFIDAYSLAGVPEPPDRDNFEGDRGNPPPERAGITPQHDVRDGWDPSDSAVGGFRKLGFTAAHVAPREGMLAGQGAVVLLREPGRHQPREAVILTGPASLIGQMDEAPGLYPGTSMAVMAVFRDRFTNARRLRDAEAAYASDPTSGPRPNYDPTLEPLGATLDGSRPFVFRAGSVLNGFRGLRLADEMDLPMVLADVPDAHPLLGKLEGGQTAVFAPLALPDTVKADSAAMAAELPESDAPDGGVSFVSERRTLSFRDVADETTALTVQRRAAVRRWERSPAALAEAEVPFAFGSFEVKPSDVRENLRRMIAAGLSPDDALAALTTKPASLLGLDRQLGTVEPGKMANLVVTTGDYFADTTDVHMVIVEGVQYEVESSSDSSDTPPDPKGAWDVEAEGPGGTQTGTLTIEQTGDAYGGSIKIQGETIELDEVTLDGAEMTVRFRMQGNDVTLSVTLSGDEFAGTVDVPGAGALPVTGTRQPEVR